jgi:hypothetical protein
MPALRTSWLENKEYDQCEGNESGTDHHPLRVKTHAGVTELPPASFCRQTHGFRAGVEFSAENRPESAPRAAFGREHGGVFWSLFDLQPLERV